MQWLKNTTPLFFWGHLIIQLFIDTQADLGLHAAMLNVSST